jgi:hypothetical protein
VAVVLANNDDLSEEKTGNLGEGRHPEQVATTTW